MRHQQIGDPEALSAAARALAKHTPPLIASSTVAIVGARTPTVRQIGSGTLLAIADAKFVVTAAHVLVHAKEFGMTIGVSGGDDNSLTALSGNWIVTSAEMGDPAVCRSDFPTLMSLANVSKAIDAANADNVPVVIVQNRTPTGSPLFASGSAGWQLNGAVTSRHHDHYIEKQLPSAFAGTDLLQSTENNSIQILTVVGYMTHNCVAATVFEALHAALMVEVLSDATGSVPYANRAGRGAPGRCTRRSWWCSSRALRQW